MRELTPFGHLPLEVGAGLFQRCERVVLPGCAGWRACRSSGFSHDPVELAIYKFS